MKKTNILWFIGIFLIIGSMNVFGFTASTDVVYNFYNSLSGGNIIDNAGKYNATYHNSVSLVNYSYNLNLGDITSATTSNPSQESWFMWVVSNDTDTSINNYDGTFAWGNHITHEIVFNTKHLYVGIAGATYELKTWSCSVSDGSYHSFAVVYRGLTSGEIYCDGLSNLNFTLAGNRAVPNTYDYIGGDTSNIWKGNISNFMKINKSLNSSEIATLHSNGRIYNYFNTSSSSVSNFSISAVNSWNSSSVLNFSATDGITNWTTLTGVIVTNHLSNDTDLPNFTITAPLFNTAYSLNTNTSSNLSISLTPTDITPPSIYCSLNGLTNVSGYTTNLNITITEPYLTNTTIRPEGLNNETNNSHRTNHYYGSSNWNITNISNIGSYQINISATDFNNNSANYTCNYTIIPNNSTFKIYVYDYLNSTLISSISIFDTNTSETQTNNPFSKDTTNYLSKLIPWNLVQMNIEDTSYYHIDQNSSFNITRFRSIFSTSMTPNKLILSFYSGGNLTTTTGFVNDEYPSTRGFTNTSIVIIQQNLSEGKVQVIFNDYANWTQYYEYINDYKTFINESLEIIPKVNLWSGYFQVLDVSGSPIENAVVRMQYSIGTNSTTQYGMLLGQRLTAPDGYTFFIADKSSQAYLTIYKNGYTPQTYQLSFGDESFTRSSPKVFYLKQENSIVKENAWAYIPYEYRTITPIPITITSIDYDKIEIQTPFRNTSGFSLKDVTNKDILGRTRFYLYPGQDYNSTSPEDIVLYIYLDNELWTNYTIKYNAETNTTKIFTPTETDSSMQTKIGAVVEFLALLIMILIMNLLFKESRAGLHTFMGGTIILAIINPLYFIWLGFVGGGFYIFKIVQYIISE